MENLVIFPSMILKFLIDAFWDSDAKRVEKIFAGRESSSRSEFYERYFSSEGIPENVVTRILNILESYLGVDLSRLHKDDSFASNLSYFFEIDDFADVEIVIDLEHEFSITITDDEAKRTKTIDDIVQLVWRKMNASY